MSELADYVIEHTSRGECQCGKCIDVGLYNFQPLGHTADLIFFKVSAIKDPEVSEFLKLTEAHLPVFGDKLNLLDGEEHGYMELGGWIGDQGLALQYMGLGTILGVFELLTPKTVLGKEGLPEDLIMKMASSGYVTIKTARKPAELSQA